MKSILVTAIQIAVQAHGETLDKSGQPYILHPLRVMMAQMSDVSRIAGILHDVVEDTNVTIDDLRSAGIPEESLTAIVMLTHEESEPYEEYINKLYQNHIAKSVKLADLLDNMNVLRLPGFTQKDLGRLAKYRRAYEFLSEET
tara:strand:- start:212 stop:640 length:429 start_codon:yes stop_codon:yes gene_type:complete